jgi:hypothetical protein
MARRGHPEFTLADGTPVSPGKWWGGDEPEDTLDGSKARLDRLKLGEQYPAGISTDSARGLETLGNNRHVSDIADTRRLWLISRGGQGLVASRTRWRRRGKLARP